MPKKLCAVGVVLILGLAALPVYAAANSDFSTPRVDTPTGKMYAEVDARVKNTGDVVWDSKFALAVVSCTGISSSDLPEPVPVTGTIKTNDSEDFSLKIEVKTPDSYRCDLQMHDKDRHTFGEKQSISFTIKEPPPNSDFTSVKPTVSSSYVVTIEAQVKNTGILDWASKHSLHANKCTNGAGAAVSSSLMPKAKAVSGTIKPSATASLTLTTGKLAIEQYECELQMYGADGKAFGEKQTVKFQIGGTTLDAEITSIRASTSTGKSYADIAVKIENSGDMVWDDFELHMTHCSGMDDSLLPKPVQVSGADIPKDEGSVTIRVDPGKTGSYTCSVQMNDGHSKFFGDIADVKFTIGALPVVAGAGKVDAEIDSLTATVSSGKTFADFTVKGKNTGDVDWDAKYHLGTTCKNLSTGSEVGVHLAPQPEAISGTIKKNDPLSVSLKSGDLTAGDYECTVQMLDPDNKPFGKTATKGFTVNGLILDATLSTPAVSVNQKEKLVTVTTSAKNIGDIAWEVRYSLRVKCVGVQPENLPAPQPVKSGGQPGQLESFEVSFSPGTGKFSCALQMYDLLEKPFGDEKKITFTIKP